MNYECNNQDLFSDLGDRDFFHSFVSHQYKLASSKGSLIPEISGYSCDQAHRRFVGDRTRITNSEFGEGGELDHFKQVSLLVFWLRRFSPIQGVYAALPDQNLIKIKSRVPTEQRAKAEEIEYVFLNQQITFDIGFRILSYWESHRADSSSIYGRNIKPSDFKLVGENDHDERFMSDMYYVFSDKSLSPHSIWAIYKSLFHQLIR